MFHKNPWIIVVNVVVLFVLLFGALIGPSSSFADEPVNLDVVLSPSVVSADQSPTPSTIVSGLVTKGSNPTSQDITITSLALSKPVVTKSDANGLIKATINLTTTAGTYDIYASTGEITQTLIVAIEPGKADHVLWAKSEGIAGEKQTTTGVVVDQFDNPIADAYPALVKFGQERFAVTAAPDFTVTSSQVITTAGQINIKFDPMGVTASYTVTPSANLELTVSSPLTVTAGADFSISVTSADEHSNIVNGIISSTNTITLGKTITQSTIAGLASFDFTAPITAGQHSFMFWTGETTTEAIVTVEPGQTTKVGGNVQLDGSLIVTATDGINQVQRPVTITIDAGNGIQTVVHMTTTVTASAQQPSQPAATAPQISKTMTTSGQDVIMNLKPANERKNGQIVGTAMVNGQSYRVYQVKADDNPYKIWENLGNGIPWWTADDNDGEWLKLFRALNSDQTLNPGELFLLP